MSNEFLPVMGFMAVGIAILTVIVKVLHRKAQRRFEELAPAFELGTARLAGPLSNAIVGLYRGYTCRYLVQHPSQYDRGGAHLRIALHSPIQWSAEREHVGSKLLARIGLVSDRAIGDRELDEHFRFSAAREEDLDSALAAETVREALHLLVADENFQSISVRADRMDIKWSPRNPELDDNPDVLRTRLESATTFASTCGHPPTLDH